MTCVVNKAYLSLEIIISSEMISLSAQMGRAQEVINIYNDYRLDKPFNIHETIGDRKYKVHWIKIVRFI